MKKILIYLYIGFSLVSCKQGAEKSTYISVLADKTSDNMSVPTIQDIYQVLENGKEVTTAVTFSYQIISNTDINKRHTLSLPPYSMFENTLKRKTEVNRFFNAIDTLFHRQQAIQYEYNRSNIFVPLVQQLETLQQSDATEKVVLLYSDLVEYSSLFNGYKNSHTQNINAIVDLFRSQVLSNSYDGITLYINYYPNTPLENQHFSDFCKIYKAVFKDTGLKIRIGMDKQISLNHEN
ncbi:hypothetical protein [uncultured Kordia sp.]|uniref:hypothetical protein n=1 Tax=uncultured Kordia sp. TaxID=507699 RepID=UPI0026369103|nr:hypothetical protein [uncultured Kordia sp.]